MKLEHESNHSIVQLDVYVSYVRKRDKMLTEELSPKPSKQEEVWSF